MKRVLWVLMVTLVSNNIYGFSRETEIGATDAHKKKTEWPSGDVVIQWNQVLQLALSVPGAQPPTVSGLRSFAMMHVAIFDAVNAIDRSYKTYFARVKTCRGASTKAAAAQAAHDILTALYPQQQSTFDAQLQLSLEGIPPGRARNGIAVGQDVAEQILAWRSRDGWDAVPPPYVLPMQPGLWQPTPPAFSPAAFTHFPNVTPFATTSSAQFRPPPPPELTSDEYASAFNETKDIGFVNSASRTADQTLVAMLWAAVGTPTGSANIWNNVAQAVALAKGNTLVENARLFALLNIALHDGLQTSFTSKFYYGLWRPVTAIRRADEDSNPATTADANWLPLLVTPPYPTYAGNASTIGKTAATILASFFRCDDISFEAHWEGLEGSPGWTRSYSSFSALANEQANSRVYGGIHFRFDNVAGQSIGTNVANYVFQNFLVPCRHNRDR
jgi:hypothetical protein